ncbi:MAG: bifunctional nuclease family protein [Nitrospinae bacterium]|nr:bifunctional nuclease family protein [Nitrospinota bacterium]
MLDKERIIEVKIEGLILDPMTNMPIVLLKNLEGNKALPIWVGVYEANAIASVLEDISTPRPLTHELINNILSGMRVNVERVVVNDLRENTFYALIFLMQNGSLVKIDSRPSDAIAIALRHKAPIFVSEKVFEDAKVVDLEDQESLKNMEKKNLKDWLDNLSPKDFV